MWRGALSSCPCLIHPQCHGVLWMLLLLCSCELGLSVKRYAGIPATPSAPEARARLAVFVWARGLRLRALGLGAALR